MTNLPNNFQFSQSNLQDYLDCPRRFELKYILQIKWPAPISEPVVEFEHHIRQGVLFHQMVQQYLSGIPLELISVPPDDLDLARWWQNFIQFPPFQPTGQLTLPEYRLSIPFYGFRLVAQMDLVLVDPGGLALIFDWKTSRVHPKRQSVLKRVQSHLYPLVLSASGIHGQPVNPDYLTMKYWYAGFPDRPDEIKYSQDLFKADKEYIHDLVETIRQTQSGYFDLTPETRKCAFCNYRSLCDRGEKAGTMEEYDEDGNDSDVFTDFDFNNIPEISF